MTPAQRKYAYQWLKNNQLNSNKFINNQNINQQNKNYNDLLLKEQLKNNRQFIDLIINNGFNIEDIGIIDDDEVDYKYEVYNSKAAKALNDLVKNKDYQQSVFNELVIKEMIAGNQKNDAIKIAKEKIKKELAIKDLSKTSFLNLI